MVLARGVLRFLAFALPAAGSRRKLAAAIRLKVAQASPFAQTDGYAVVEGGRAAVWYWDRAWVARQLREAGLDPEQSAVVPEPLLEPPGDGVRLLRCADGFEGRVERRGTVLASQWWPALPDEKDWEWFCRDQGQSLPRPAPQAVAPGERPFAPNALDWDVAPWWQNERLVYALLATLICIPAGYWGGAWVRLAVEQAGAERAAQQLQAGAAGVVEARAAALTESDFVIAVSDLRQYPDPLQLLASVASAVPADGLQFNEVDVRPGSIRVQFMADNALPGVAVTLRQLEATGLFDDVQVTTDSGSRQLTITASVLPIRAGEARR